MKFHKVRDVSALSGMRLSVQFANGTTKIYDVAPSIRRLPVSAALEDESLFGSVEVNQGGYGIVWDDALDLYCDELWGIEWGEWHRPSTTSCRSQTSASSGALASPRCARSSRTVR